MATTIMTVGNLHAQMFGSMWEMGQRLHVAYRCAQRHGQDHHLYGGCSGPRALWVGLSKMPSGPGELAALLATPYREGIDHITRARALLDGELDGLIGFDRKRFQMWSEDDGEELDLDRLHAGRPFWRSTRVKRVKGQAKEVAIVCNVSAAGSRSPYELAWTGAAAGAVADLAESRGIRSEIWACDAATDVYTRRPHDVLVSTRLKAAGEPLDVANIAILAAPWFLRVGLFSLEHVEHSPTDTSSYGRVERYRPLRDLMPADHTGLPSADPAPITIEHVFSLEAAARAVRAAVEALTGEEAGA